MSAPETDYLDVTTPTIKTLQERRPFSSRESRVISNGIVDIFSGSKLVDGLEERKNTVNADGREDLNAFVDILRAERDTNREITEMVIVRFSALRLSKSCDDRVYAVQLRYVIHKFPGWTSRTDMEMQGPISYIDSDWIELE